MTTIKQVALILFALPSLALSWGWQGHKLITELAIDRLPPEIRAVYAPVMKELLDATVEPDKRVFKDPREGPKHYLNVEVLDPDYRAAWDQAGADLKKKPKRHKKSKDAPPPAEGDEESHTPPLQQATFEGRLPLADAEVDRLFASIPRDTGAFFKFPGQYQREMGLVVYQPAHYYGELVKAFRANDPARIAGVTGFLSHYVGDLHVPLHNTVNHDGSFSKSRFLSKGPNSTVHSRFETGLLKFLTPALNSLGAKHLQAPTPQAPAAITERVIKEAREAYALHPSVIAADRETMAKFPGKTIQWQRFHAEWQPKMAPVVGQQIGRSAQMLADLIVTAWAEAKR